jgi:hypothetical protein
MFDSGYLARGLALIASLRCCAETAEIVVLALDDDCHAYLANLGIPGVGVMTVEDLVAEIPDLASARLDRTPVDFIFTCTASLTDLLLSKAAAGEWVVYLDSDMYFFSSPQSIFDAAEFGTAGIVPHRYSPKLSRLHKYGTYNVGWVMFRGGGEGDACCRWWRDSTIEWCHDFPDNGRYADQGYLDEFKPRFPGTVILEDAGVNVAPWNLGRHQLTVSGGRVHVDGARPLVFFHFQGLRREGRTWFPNLRPYRTRLDDVIRHEVYEPYIEELLRIESGAHWINEGYPLRVRTTKAGSRDAIGWRARVRRARRVAVNTLDQMTGQVLTLDATEVVDDKQAQLPRG